MSRRYRLYPEPAESPVLVMHCDHARFVWNLALEQWNEWRPGRRHAPGYVEQARQLTEARAEFDWLAAGSTVVQQGALRDFQQAKSNFHRHTHGRPRFRSRRDRTQGFLVRDAQVRR